MLKGSCMCKLLFGYSLSDFETCVHTKYHTTNKCTNCMSFILNHFFKTLFLLLRVSIAYRLSSSGSTYIFQLKSRVKNIYCCGSISCICVRCFSCREASPLASMHEKQHTDMLPQQYYDEKVHILTRDFSQKIYVLPDDDKQYAIETCRSSESVLKK